MVEITSCEKHRYSSRRGVCPYCDLVEALSPLAADVDDAVNQVRSAFEDERTLLNAAMRSLMALTDPPWHSYREWAETGSRRAADAMNAWDIKANEARKVVLRISSHLTTERDSSPPRDDTREPSKSVVSGRHIAEAES